MQVSFDTDNPDTPIELALPVVRSVQQQIDPVPRPSTLVEIISPNPTIVSINPKNQKDVVPEPTTTSQHETGSLISNQGEKECLQKPQKSVTIVRKEEQIPSVITVTTETICTETHIGNVQHVDFTRDGVPPHQAQDILNIMPGIIKDSGEMLFERAVRADMWFIYIIITIINILVLLSALFGINSTWYKNLKRSKNNPWLIGSLWVIATILSYGAIFMLWEHVTPEAVAKDMQLSIYFMIGNFLSLLWSTVFFQGNNIALSVWIAALLFLYQFWLFIYIWILKIRAAMFMIPLIILYGYLFYAMIHIATLNNIIV